MLGIAKKHHNKGQDFYVHWAGKKPPKFIFHLLSDIPFFSYREERGDLKAANLQIVLERLNKFTAGSSSSG